MSAPSTNEVYRTAQALIRMGQPVFTCFAKQTVRQGKTWEAKQPMTKWRDNATTDKDQVKRWLKSQPDAALAIPTGILWDVLDVDTKGEKDGRSHLISLQRLGYLNGCKRVVKTPSGGWHLYFRPNPASPLSNKGRSDLGLDVRGLGGYVLVAPSYIETDKYAGSYVDMGEPVGGNDDPLWWDLIENNIAPVNTLTKKPVELLNYERQGSIAALRVWLSERREGERNNSLHWAVSRCIENGIDPNELAEVAMMIGLREDETQATIGSALSRAGVSLDELQSEAEILFGG